MTTYRIALLGDGLFESWGECHELHTELRRLYQLTDFEIYNHGRYNSRAGYGLFRIANASQKPGGRSVRVVPPLLMDDPHIVVVESFAYTQRADGPEGLTEYRDLLRAIWAELEATTRAKRIFAIGPPPLRDRFGESAPELVNTSRALRSRMADDERLYLDEARGIAQDEGWPMTGVPTEIDKLIGLGDSPRRFVNGADNILPSRYGFEAMAAALVQTMDEFRYIEEKKSE